MGVADPAVAPDGSAVTVTVSRVDVDANRTRAAVWLVAASGDDAPPRQLTAGDESDGGARWSPRGDGVAFVRTTVPAGGSPRWSLLVLPVGGPGEAVTVAESTEAITAIDWSPDGARLAWCTRVPVEGADVADRDREPRRIDRLVSRYDDVGWTVDRPQHVFVRRVDRTEPARQVTTGPVDHGSPRWSPDGTRLVVVAGRHDTADIDELDDLFLVDPDGGEPVRLTATDRSWAEPSWSPDGTRLAALAVDPSHGFRNVRPVVLSVGDGTVVDLAPRIDRTFAPYPGARSPVWLDDGALLVAREDRGCVGVLRVAADGAAEPAEVVGGRRVVGGYHAAGGTLAFIAGTPTEPAELFVGERRATSFTAAFVRACPPVAPERFTVGSPAGGELDAWFLAPAGEGPWPLVVSVHGGPMTQYGEAWFDEFQLWAGAGFAVVATNPHGSSGREEAFARSIRSPLAEVDPGSGWGGIDAEDVLAVLDATLERWPVDPDRVAVLGGSYGGFMTTWLLARTDRFAAGVSERAVNNLLSEEWSADVGGHFARELGVSHLEHPEEYLRMSPATYVASITAPVLILHSENDLRCPIEQADALFVPLRLLGRDVEYWRFPGEGHELSRSGSPTHRIRRAELIVDFLRRRLGVG